MEVGSASVHLEDKVAGLFTGATGSYPCWPRAPGVCVEDHAIAEEWHHVAACPQGSGPAAGVTKVGAATGPGATWPTMPGSS